MAPSFCGLDALLPLFPEVPSPAPADAHGKDEKSSSSDEEASFVGA